MAISDELALLLQSKESIKDSINEKVGSEIIDDNTPFDYYPNKILDIKGLPHEYSSGATASGATSYERVASHLAILSSTKQNMASAIKECGVEDFDENVLSAYSVAIEKIKKAQGPLTFKIISGGTIVWKASNTANTKTISYSTDNGDNWTNITSNTGSSTPYITVSDGDTVMFKGDNASYGNTTSSYNTFSGSTAKFEVEGNIMSLIDSTGFATATTLQSAYTFYYLFANCTGLTSAENLVLPATTSANYCYANMFQGCTSLTSAPSILPATTLTRNCYESMFRGCTSLTTAPVLPATTSANYCYRSMFQGCTSLNYIKCLATNISAVDCTGGWVYNVASSGTFVKNPNMSSWTKGTSGIPGGWTVEDAT